MAKLTANQIREQLAIRVFLGCPVTGATVEVRRTGKKEELVHALEGVIAKEVAAREARDGPDGYDTEVEVTRLNQLTHMGRAPRSRRPREHRAQNDPKRKRRATNESSSDTDASSDQDRAESDDEDDEASDDELDPDLAAALQDNSMYRIK